MATRTWGVWTWAVEESALEENCPAEYAAFYAALAADDQYRGGNYLGGFANDLYEAEIVAPPLNVYADKGQWIECWVGYAPDPVFEAYLALVRAFFDATQVAIWLKALPIDAIGLPHDAESCWEVAEESTIYTLTPGAGRLGAKLNVKAWAESG